MTWMNRQYDYDIRRGMQRERHRYDFSRVHNLEKVLQSESTGRKRSRHETITPETAYPYQQIHGLRQCKHCARYMNRDMHADKNIGECFIQQYTTGIRHAAFIRQPKSTTINNQLLDHDTEQHSTAVPEIKKEEAFTDRTIQGFLKELISFGHQGGYMTFSTPIVDGMGVHHWQVQSRPQIPDSQPFTSITAYAICCPK